MMVYSEAGCLTVPSNNFPLFFYTGRFCMFGFGCLDVLNVGGCLVLPNDEEILKALLPLP